MNIRTSSMVFGLLSALSIAACGTDATPPGAGGSGGATSAGGGGASATAQCAAPVEHPHDPSKAVWSYHDAENGPDKWGELAGDETCGVGNAQTPIDIVPGTAEPSALVLEMLNYDKAIPVDLLNNGHTLQINYAGSMSAEDPQIHYNGKTYYLLQFHWHSTSEHTVEGKSYPFEAHFVHKSEDGSLAVVGVFFEKGSENATLATLLHDNPGHEEETTCEGAITLNDLLPTQREFFHYEGSLTTPPCSEGLNWFVMKNPLQVSADQEERYQEGFEGTTNRPIQPLNGRMVHVYTQ